MVTLFWIVGVAFFVIPIVLLIFVAFLAMTDQTTLEEKLEEAEWLEDVDQNTKN